MEHKYIEILNREPYNKMYIISAKLNDAEKKKILGKIASDNMKVLENYLKETKQLQCEYVFTINICYVDNLDNLELVDIKSFSLHKYCSKITKSIFYYFLCEQIDTKYFNSQKIDKNTTYPEKFIDIHHTIIKPTEHSFSNYDTRLDLGLILNRVISN